MRFFNGCWHYQGQAYTTPHAAFLAAWPENVSKLDTGRKVAME